MSRPNIFLGMYSLERSLKAPKLRNCLDFVERLLQTIAQHSANHLLAIFSCLPPGNFLHLLADCPLERHICHKELEHFAKMA